MDDPGRRGGLWVTGSVSGRDPSGMGLGWVWDGSVGNGSLWSLLARAASLAVVEQWGQTSPVLVQCSVGSEQLSV